MPPIETPAELAEWMETRAKLLSDTARRIRTKAKVQEAQPVRAWLLPLLEDFSHAEVLAKRAVHLLSAYGLRTGTATPTEVSRATDVTVTAATNRAASRIAREAWSEVWPN